MRLAGQAKLGYFAIPPEVTSLILKHLSVADEHRDRITMLDPCCGEGAALKQLSEGLGVKPDRVYGVELDRERAKAAEEALPEAKILCGSFMGIHLTGTSQSLVYCNPPFDDQIGGGGREELSFVTSATSKLIGGQGILCLVCPYNQVRGNTKMVDWLDSHYEQIRMFRFPSEHRSFREIVTFAVRRKVEIPDGRLYELGELHQQGMNYRSYNDEDGVEFLSILGEPWRKANQNVYDRKPSMIEESVAVYKLLPCIAPHSFKRIAFTDGELQEKLAEDHFDRLLMVPREVPVARPPLPLGRGHVAIMLAAGMLNGVVHSSAGSHVVRGTSRKVEYVSDRVTTEDADTGSVTEKVTHSERIEMSIRAVDQSGVIKTFTDAPPPAADLPPDEDESEGDDVDEE